MKKLLLILLILVSTASFSQEITLNTELFIVNNDTIIKPSIQPYLSVLTFVVDLNENKFIQNTDGQIFIDNVIYQRIKNDIIFNDGKYNIILSLNKKTNSFTLVSDCSGHYVGTFVIQ